MPEVAVLVPTLGRPQALAPLLDSLEANTPEGVYAVVFVLDHDDADSYREIARLNRPYVRVMVVDGTYPHKINAGCAATNEPWVLLTADDVKFHPGWWEAAMATSQVGVIGTNDLHNRSVQRGVYATQILVSRPYIDHFGTIDEPGKVFHEGYHHNCIDVELCETAKARGAYVHAHDSVIEHLHPDHGHREADATDEKGNRCGRDADHELLITRRALWTT